MTLTDWIDEASEESRADTGLSQNTEIAIAYETGYQSGALAAVEKLSAMGVGEIDKLYKDAHKEICDLASGKRKWTMCIPPQPDDSDILLQSVIDQGRALLAARDLEIARLKSELSKAEALLREAHSQLWRTDNEVAVKEHIDDYFSEQAKGGDHVE